MVGDIPFFTSLADMSNVINKFTGQIQGYVSTAFTPLSQVNGAAQLGLGKILPPQVLQVVQMVESASSHPDAFVSTMLSNYGYGMAAKTTQNQVISQITSQMGSSFTGFNPIARMLNLFGTGSNGSTNAGKPNAVQNPESPTVLGPNTYKNGTVDTYGHPLDSTQLTSNAGSAGTTSANANSQTVQPSPDAMKSFYDAANPASQYTAPLNFTPAPASPVSAPQVGVDVSGVSTNNIA
jgi:hypothetical protein